MNKGELIFRYKGKDYWFITSNKSGSTFLLSVFNELLKNNEVEWSFPKLNVDNLEVIMYGRNPYTRFVSGFYHWWINPFAHDAHDFGSKWMWDYSEEVVIQQKNDNNQILENKFMKILNDDGVSNKQKNNYMIKFWKGWIQSQPEEIRIEKFRHFTKVFYAYMKEWGYGAKQFQQWAGQHLNWQVSDSREVNRLFPMSNNLDQVYDDEYIDVFVKKWSKNTLKIENFKDNFVFRELVNVDKIRKQPQSVNQKTPSKNINNKTNAYISHYDDETINIVNEMYKCDFLLFNYKMVENKDSLTRNLSKNS